MPSGSHCTGNSRNWFKNILSQKVIEPAQTKWATLLVLAPIKDGSLRSCINYQRLNILISIDWKSILRMDKYTDFLSETTLFLTLSASKEYWQVKIEDENHDKTAFTSNHVMNRFFCMAFGLKKTAATTFQQTEDVILASIVRYVAIVFLDDTFIPSKNF